MGWILWALRVGAAMAFARAGGGHGFSSGGGSFHSSGGSYSGSSSGDGGALVYLWIQFVLRHPVVGLSATIIVLYFFYYGADTINETRISRTISTGLQAQDGLALGKNLAALKRRDPAFEPSAFLERVKTAFLSIQAAWSAADMIPARAFVSDGVMERFTLQLAMLKASGMRNDLQQVQVSFTEILQLESTAFWDAAHVRFAASAVDRDLSLADNSVLRGGSQAQPFEEVWTFVRRPSAKTLAGRGALEGACPNCGAPLELRDSEQCKACKSWLNSGEFDWVLCAITQASEWSARDPGRDVQGFAAMAEKDPALNTRFLEDRACVAFWRFQEALWNADAKALRAVADDAFCEALEKNAREKPAFYRDAAVGAVIALAVEPGQPRDRAHVLVRWSGRRWEGGKEQGSVYVENVLILERKAGVATDPKAGLRSLRCASCGAPPTERETAVCAYCGDAFNDGSRQWVLARVIPAVDWKRPEVLAQKTAPGADLDYGWTATLSPEAAMRVMASAIASDGMIASEERSYLETFAKRRGVPEETAVALLAAARAGRIEMPAPSSTDEACAFLRGVIVMSLADGRVDPVEREAIGVCAKRLSLTPRGVDDLIKEERRKLYACAKEAIKERG